MTYASAVTVPSNTTIENPLITRIKVISGILTKVGVYIPPGHAGLTGFSIYQASTQVYPFDRDTWVRGNNLSIVDEVNYDIDISESELLLYTYNLDDLIDHTFEYRITVEKFDVLSVLSEINGTLLRLEESGKSAPKNTGVLSKIFGK